MTPHYHRTEMENSEQGHQLSLSPLTILSRAGERPASTRGKLLPPTVTLQADRALVYVLKLLRA